MEPVQETVETTPCLIAQALGPSGAGASPSDEHDTDVEITEASVPVSTSAPPLTPSEILRKPASALTDEERQRLIDDARSGKDHEHFNVKFFKNGNTRITQRKLTKTQQLLSNNVRATPTEGRRTYLTNDQLLMEHIIDLESRFTKMSVKHKKLKKRYNELENTIYEDELSEPQAVPQMEPQMERTPCLIAQALGPSGAGASPVGETPEPITRAAPVVSSRARGWRSRLV